MSKRKIRARPKSKQPTLEQQKTETQLKKQIATPTTTLYRGNLLYKIISAVLGLTTVAGFSFAIWTYYNPQISIKPYASLDPNNALRTTFEIANSGKSNIHNVSLYIAIKFIHFKSRIHGGTVTIKGDENYKSRFVIADNIPIIRAGESITVKAPDELSAPITMNKFKENQYYLDNAEIVVEARFKLKFIPHQITIRKGFTTESDIYGNLVWIPVPIPISSN